MEELKERTNRELIEKLFKIQDKRRRVVPFKLNPAQEYYWARKTRRNILLKARQKGLSKVIDADQLIDCIKKTTNAVVISHEREATRRLFNAVKFYIDNLEVKPYMTTENKNEIKFPKRNSFYYIGTAGQRAFGRGDTIHRAHLSEAAFYPDLDKILAGVSEAAEYGEIDIESTANGRGNPFYDLWMKAKSGKSSYTPIFIPWFIDDEYSADSMTVNEILGLSETIREMFAIPALEFEYDDEETELIERVKKEYGKTLTAGQIKWRRYKKWDLADRFFQEYPEDDVSCFLQSGRNVFHQITCNEGLRGELEKGKRYYAGLDGAEGVDGGDNHCFTIIDAREEPARVKLEIVSTEPIEMFCQRVANLCKEYDIILGVEKNGVGVAHVNKLKELGVRIVTWTTSATNRPIMIADLEEAYRNGELVETYLAAKDEALNMIYDDSNRPGHPQGKHDDRIFSRAIAWQMRGRVQPGIKWA